MRRLLAVILLCATLFLTACGQTQEPGPSAAETPAPTAEAECPDEVARAIACGLVPDDIQGDYGAGITFSQYSRMLTNLIRIWDESRLEEWEDTIALAAASDEPMLREDGILATAYAMVLMGANTPEGFSHTDIDAVMENLDSNGDQPSWSYPLFPTWEETGFEWCGSNYMWGGMTTCACLISRISGLAVYPYDFEGKSAHLQDPLTRQEAICAVLRLGETDHSFLEPDGTYVQLADAGAYDGAVITDELLAAASDLPEPTQAALPSSWRGAGLSSLKNGSGSECADFRETDIKLLADSGFNFTRVFFNFSTLRFPDYPEDGRLVNENELRDLDQLIAWGMEYGVHIQLAMSFYLDECGNAKTDGSIAANDGEWAIVRDYWAMLARRYAGIPSKYLSFDLCNEIQPVEGDDFDYSKAKLGEVVSAIRAEDPERVLLHSFQGNPDADWVEAAASLGLAVGCHPYYPQYIATTDYAYAEQNPYAYPCWPQPWFPIGKVQDGQAPLVIEGSLSGAELSLYVNDGMEGTEIRVSSGGQLLETFTLSGGTPLEEGSCFYGRLYTAALPEGTAQVEIRVSGGYARLDTVIVSGSMGEVVMVPHDTADYLDFSDPLPLVVRDDGTYTNSEDRLIDGEAVYEVDVKPYEDIAEKYGVGFMVNEFGIFGSNVYWDIGIVAAYHDSVLQMLTGHGLGWCYCELYNALPKHLIIMPGSGVTQFQWSGATEQPLTVTCESGEELEYIVNKELMEVFLKYTREA